MSDQPLLPTFDPTVIELVRSMTVPQLVERAIALLKQHEPAEGYYLAFSGGKDSCAIKNLAQLAGVKFEARYSNTTIDPPELVHFIKKHHPDVIWNNPAMAMMTRVATCNKPPPTRMIRWCCDEYKEAGGGPDRVKVFGVRAAESARRAKNWFEVVLPEGSRHTRQYVKAICPVVYWCDDQLWAFIRSYGIPYCTLYDQGFKRLGCVGCPLADSSRQSEEFRRWPRYETNWKRAVIANWERMKDRKREDGKPYMHARFRTGEDFWNWWRYERKPDLYREECQTGLLWTNQELDEL